jgi:hypothetical protein
MWHLRIHDALVLIGLGGYAINPCIPATCSGVTTKCDQHPSHMDSEMDRREPNSQLDPGRET